MARRKTTNSNKVKAKNGHWKFCEVKWSDAKSDAHWQDHANLHGPATIISRGWLVINEKTHITLAASYMEPEEGDEVSDVGEIITIPRGCIVLITEIEVSE